MEVKISVIMPSLNVAEYIGECIESVINQTLKDIEIICIDAGSTDGTCGILKRYSEKDSRIKLIHSDLKSYGYQVNVGILQSQGKYIEIVETDDFIEADMLETLYHLAEENNLDFVKADYDYFILDNNKKKMFWTVNLLENYPELYEVVIKPRNFPYLYANDYNVWKGIYNKKFLIENNIWMNESRGAAYQDIGFSDQVLSCAERGWYTRKSFYRYRRDRNESSIHSVDGLKYSYNEFKRELETPEIRKKLGCMEGVYGHMLQSFLGEFKKVIREVNYDLESEHIKFFREWFGEHIDLDVIDTSLDEQKADYQKLTYNPEEYVRELEIEDRAIKIHDQKVIEFTGDGSDIIVFGAGMRGNAALYFLRMNGINVKAICDNNEALWNTVKGEILIFEPGKCKSMFQHAKYIVANKKHSQEIVDQLLGMNVNRDDILIW